MAGAFTFLSVVVTAANLPLYFGCALAVLVLWRRGKIPQPGARELRWVAAALIATLYCVWVSIGLGGKSLLWALALCAVGLPVYWWYAVRSSAVAARA
jgi:APA family basic amino acid/polyamine antiporter